MNDVGLPESMVAGSSLGEGHLGLPVFRPGEPTQNPQIDRSSIPTWATVEATVPRSSTWGSLYTSTFW